MFISCECPNQQATGCPEVGTLFVPPEESGQRAEKQLTPWAKGQGSGEVAWVTTQAAADVCWAPWWPLLAPNAVWKRVLM